MWRRQLGRSLIPFASPLACVFESGSTAPVREATHRNILEPLRCNFVQHCSLLQAEASNWRQSKALHANVHQQHAVQTAKQKAASKEAQLDDIIVKLTIQAFEHGENGRPHV
jgi:hypothetical protein